MRQKEYGAPGVAAFRCASVQLDTPTCDDSKGVWRERIHWAWVPFVLLSATAIWIEHGWLVAALCLVGGLALGLFVRWRHRND
jgi:hypothetical protein